MKLDPVYRPVVAAVLVVAGVFIVVPFRYWSTLATVLQLGAMVGLCVLRIHRHLRK